LVYVPVVQFASVIEEPSVAANNKSSVLPVLTPALAAVASVTTTSPSTKISTVDPFHPSP